MSCEHVKLPGGGHAIICSRGARRAKCQDCEKRPHSLLCDWKLTGAKAGKTCDRKLCHACASSPAKNKHLCRAHARAWEGHPKNTSGKKAT